MTLKVMHGAQTFQTLKAAPCLVKTFVMLSVTHYVREHGEAYEMFPQNLHATVTAYTDYFVTPYHPN